MDIKCKTNSVATTELIKIDGVGFTFEINQSLKHNLISPNVLAFFYGIPESEETTECAFPKSIPNTNIYYSIFHNIGYDWVVCSDGIFRKCQKIKCIISINRKDFPKEFYIDNSLNTNNITGVLACKSNEI